MAKSFVQNPFRGSPLLRTARLLCACLLVAGATPRDAALAASARAEDRRAAGRELLDELRAVFAPEGGTPAAHRPDAPRKSVTLLLHEFDAARAGLPAEAVADVEDWLARDADATHVLESPHFRFTYATTGTHAVPAEDATPANGVPDFVERLAAYGETAWSRLVDDAGFAAPRLAAGRVDVGFLAMSAYGFTRVVDGVPAITLHCTFAGFPDNEDPDGTAAGCAKVTMAHEFKHASQYVTGAWSEGGWLEADATWAEDFVFDEPNDYLRFLPSNSPISSPSDWLPVSYEDCVFPAALAEEHGPGVLVDFFARRAAAPGETVPATWDAVLRSRGSSWREAMARLALWSWFCGANAPGRPFGFEEADRFPTPPIAAHLETTRQSRLRGMGTEYLLATGAGRSGRPHASIAGDLQAPFVAWVVTLQRDGRRGFARIPTAANAGAVELPQTWEELATLTVLVTNAATGGEAPYGASLDGEGAVDAPELAGTTRLELHPNRPNPFRESTVLSFSLPAPSAVRISVHDAAGRLVRRLAAGETFAAGRHERTWDGRDDSGRAAAPGFYAVRVESGGATSVRKLLIVR